MINNGGQCNNGGQRIATADGVMLADPASLGNLPGVSASRWFEPAFWAARGELVAVTGGRGSAWFVSSPPEQWALRHFRRGGCIARWSADRYLWTGEERVRAFAEWRLLTTLRELDLPVPTPIAARYQRRGLFYRCDLITRRIAGAESLSARLGYGPLQETAWREVGATVARLHAAGVDHADLNAHNILLDDAGLVSVIDFDRGRLRARGPWAARNVARLQRSLVKISPALPAGRWSAREWQFVLEGYACANSIVS